MKTEEAVAYLQDCLENELFTDDETEAIRALLEGYQAAVKCIRDVETYGELGSLAYMMRTIAKWRGPEPGGEVQP